MKMQVHNETLPASLEQADVVYIYFADDSETKFTDMLELLGKRGHGYNDMDIMLRDILSQVKATDHLLVMSNGSFGGIHQKLLDGLQS